jgi:DNA-binding transcriptional regulator LsrR (DeoR family)
VENLSLYSVEARLARLLLDEAEKGVYQRPSWKTQSEIAAQLGTVLDVVNRNLQNLQKQGIIEINRTEIRILDKTKLEALSRS